VVHPRTNPFDTHHGRYENWFTRHKEAYISELMAIRALLPLHGRGLEIGVGTGRFASPLGVEVGIDPSREMLAYSVTKGISCIQGMAETLSFKDEVFDYCLIVTTICFVNDPKVTLNEAHRVLKPGASIVIGFIDRTSSLGQYYMDHQAENVFYRDATFYSPPEVDTLLSETGFFDQTWVQTLSKQMSEIQEIEPLRSGHGNGAFVVVRAKKT
jgi:ubiquinone/menaquinone biosynthesis C-methylase UbiE